ncbi:MAG TPA: hypothetical protein VM305_09510 [Candidatus Limnocylindrales bacterium]|nr:hypothetical protein [Candidatus Limnocylindrales bacterium]
MPDEQRGTAGVPSGRVKRTLGLVMLATSLAVGGAAFDAAPAEASQKKVVIVVGPVGKSTASFKRVADETAAAARNNGAQVVKVYSPNATWGRVRAAAQGAHVFIYLGHGNGWPSPYKPFQTRTKNGIGVNARLNSGNNNHKYYGEAYMASELPLARGAAVILMRLCYASGNSEPGKANPTKSVAMQRVDNYGAGFLRGPASVVFADGLGKTNYILAGLLRSNRTMAEIFWTAPHKVGAYRIQFAGTRSSGRAIMDPRRPGLYYRSVIGNLNLTASDWR